MPDDPRRSRGAICSDRDRVGAIRDPLPPDHCSLGGILRQRSSMEKAKQEMGMVMAMEP